MTTIHDAYINALLADAAYAIDANVNPNTSLATLPTLTARVGRMSAALSAECKPNYFYQC